MKRFLGILCIVFALAMSFVSCCGTSSDNGKQVCDADSTFNTVLCKEYKSIKDTAPNTVYYTSIIELDTTFKDSCVVLGFTDVYQDGPLSTTITHAGDSVKVDVRQDYWLEDVKFDPDTLNLSLEGAYNRLQEADIVKPTMTKCVLRCPLGPTLVNPQYIFGVGHYFVSVDAVTGDVKSMK